MVIAGTLRAFEASKNLDNETRVSQAFCFLKDSPIDHEVIGRDH